MIFRDEYDVIIIGGGPGGSTAAKESAEKGLSVLLLERHREIGIPVRCGEAVGIAGLLEFFDKDHPIVKKYRKKFGITFVAPDGMHLELNHESEAAVLDRKIFDHELARQAAEAGANILTAANVTGLITDKETVKGVNFRYQGKDHSVNSKIVIAADGVESRAGRWAGIDTKPALSDMETCVQYTVSEKDIDKERLFFYFGNEVAPSGYLWIFPKKDGTANIGLGVNGTNSKNKKAGKYLNDFMDDHFPEASVLNTTCGGVVCGQTLDTISCGGLMIAGDAAHQTNAVSGGGIINAMKAGRIAAEVACEAVESNDVSAKKLSVYDKRWHKIQGKANRKFYKIKKIIENIGDETLNSITDNLNTKPFKKRTLINIFKQVLIDHPKIILELPSLFY